MITINSATNCVYSPITRRIPNTINDIDMVFEIDVIFGVTPIGNISDLYDHQTKKQPTIILNKRGANKSYVNKFGKTFNIQRLYQTLLKCCMVKV